MHIASPTAFYWSRLEKSFTLSAVNDKTVKNKTYFFRTRLRVDALKNTKLWNKDEVDLGPI